MAQDPPGTEPLPHHLRGLRGAIGECLRQPGHIQVEAGELEAEVEVVDCDRLGTVIDHIRVRGRKADVGQRAGRIAQHLRPGGDHLVPVEVDRTLGGAVLRSQPRDVGDARAGDSGFYQVDIDEESAIVRGHQVSPDGVRTPTPFTWTRDQLGRALDQLERALSEPDDEQDLY